MCSLRWSRASGITTGVEFAARDAAPTPVQFDRLLPAARALFPLGEAVEPSRGSGRGHAFPTRGR